MPQGLPNGARRSPRAWPLKSKGTAVVMAKLWVDRGSPSTHTVFK